MRDESNIDWKKILAFGCLAIPLLIAVACLGILLIVYRQEIPYVQNYFPTQIAQTATPPSILINAPDKDTKVTNEDFSTNLNNWGIYYAKSKTEVKDGKLFLESFNKNSFAIGYCNTCSFVVRSNHDLQSPYYLQADFNTDQQVFGASYGLVFNISTTKTSYYVFTIRPDNQTYELYKFQDENWYYLFTGKSDLIKPYPQTNTLSLDFGIGAIRLYLNGEILKDITEQHPIEDGQIGVYVHGGGFKLIVDNLFAYHK